jgi:ParB family chromosome partitioning protein
MGGDQRVAHAGRTGMSPKHTSESQEWFTPAAVIDRVRYVLGEIDLDPASCTEANATVGAKRIITVAEDGIRTPWADGHPVTVYTNPPGGRRGRSGQALMFWSKLMDLRSDGMLLHAIYFAFNGEMIQVSQGRERPAITAFPFCAPAKRIQLVRPGGQPGTSPTHHSLIVYVRGLVNRCGRFVDAFADMGAILMPLGGG